MSHHLVIDAKCLVEGTCPLTRRGNYRAADLGELVLTYDGHQLQVTGRRFGCTVAARGEWPTPVVVPPAAFVRLMKRVPAIPDLVLTCRNGILTLGGRILAGDAKFAGQGTSHSKLPSCSE